MSSATLSVVAGVLILSFAAAQWFSQSTPVLLLFAASLPIGAICTLIATQNNSKTPPLHYISLGAISVLTTIAFGGVFGLMWQENDVRSWFISQAGSREITPVLMAAMKDPNETFAINACQQLMTSQSEETRQLAFDGLKQTPSLFHACLKDHPLEDVWQKRMVDQWYKALYSSDNTDEIRVWAATLIQASKHIDSAAAALLSCAMDTRPEHATQQKSCHALMLEDTFTADALAEQLLRSPHNPIYEKPIAARMISEMHGREELRLGFLESERLKRYAFFTACESMDLDSVEITEAFYSHNVDVCQLRAPAFREDTSFWMSVCTEVQVSASQNPDQPIEGLLCDNVRLRLTHVTTREASHRLHAALINKHSRNSLLISRLAKDIHSSAIKSNFQGNSTTQRVDKSGNYNASASRNNNALHKIGQSKFSQRRAEDPSKIIPKDMPKLDPKAQEAAEKEFNALYE